MTYTEDLIHRLRDTASRGVSSWGDLQQEAADELETLMNAVAEEREACALACELQVKIFMSTQYKTGQPLSSLGERHAAASCAEAIRARGTSMTTLQEQLAAAEANRDKAHEDMDKAEADWSKAIDEILRIKELIEEQK